MGAPGFCILFVIALFDILHASIYVKFNVRKPRSYINKSEHFTRAALHCPNTFFTATALILSCIQKQRLKMGFLDDVIILCSWKIPQHDSTINPFSGSLLKMFERSPMENFPCMSNCPILQNSLRGQISTTLCQVRIWADFSLRSCSIAAAKLQCCWLVKKVEYKRSKCWGLATVETAQLSATY